MTSRTARILGGQLTAAVVGVLATALVLGGGLAGAQEAPEAGTGVAEALAGPNTVNSAAIINGSVTGQDVANASLGRADIKGGVAPLFARVSSDGSVLTSKGVTGAQRLIAGAYQIDFNRDIRNCGWFASAANNDAGSAEAGYTTVERRSSGDVDSLEVRTFDASGVIADRASDDGFTVMVVC